MLKRKEDIYTVSVVLCYLALTLLPYLNSLSGLTIFPYILLLSLLSIIVNQINHTHCHFRTFTSAGVNRIYEILISVLRGGPCSLIVYIHNFNHHTYRGDEHDYFRLENAGHGKAYTLPWVYFFTTLQVFKNAWKNYLNEKHHKNQPLYKMVLTEKLFAYGFLIAALLWQPKTCFLFMLIPMFIGNFFLVISNLAQHHDCDPKSEFGFARNFTNVFENTIFLNAGYHTAHHIYASVHWSDLQKVHQAKMLGKVPPELIHGSLFAHIFSEYFFKSAPEKPS